LRSSCTGKRNASLRSSTILVKDQSNPECTCTQKSVITSSHLQGSIVYRRRNYFFVFSAGFVTSFAGVLLFVMILGALVFDSVFGSVFLDVASFLSKAFLVVTIWVSTPVFRMDLIFCRDDNADPVTHGLKATEYMTPARCRNHHPG